MGVGVAISTTDRTEVLIALALSDGVDSVNQSSGEVKLDNGLTQQISADASTVTVTDQSTGGQMTIHVDEQSGQAHVEVDDPLLDAEEESSIEDELEDLIEEEVLPESLASNEHWLLSLAEQLGDRLDEQYSALGETLERIAAGTYAPEDLELAERQIRQFSHSSRDSGSILRKYADGLRDIADSPAEQENRKRIKPRRRDGEGNDALHALQQAQDDLARVSSLTYRQRHRIDR